MLKHAIECQYQTIKCESSVKAFANSFEGCTELKIPSKISFY